MISGKKTNVSEINENLSVMTTNASVIIEFLLETRTDVSELSANNSETAFFRGIWNH
jgi:hypothetical protein